MPRKQTPQLDTSHAPGEMIPYDNPDEISVEVISSKCKLCNSTHKEEAEILYDRKHNISLVHRMLENKGEKISVGAVNAHMNNHYVSSKNISQLKWFDRELFKWEGVPYNRERAIQRWMTILTRELHILGSQLDTLKPYDRMKLAEQLRKIVETLINCDGKLSEIREQAEPVQIFFKQLNVIVQEKLKEDDSPQVRGFIVDVLDQLQKKAGDMVVSHQGGS